MNDEVLHGDEQRQPLTAADVFDSVWERTTRQALGPGGWDAELAIRVARDALAVVQGQLSEEEFRARHHQDYLREFGVDLRPREPADEPAAPAPNSAAGGAPPDLDDGDAGAPAVSSAPYTVRRRAALALAGSGVAALLLGDMLAGMHNAGADGGTDAHAGGHGGGHGGGAPVAKEGGSQDTGRPQMGMVIDLERCDGCLMCVSACKKAYGLPDGVHWLYVLAYKEPERPDAINLLVRPCQHCSNAPCVKVCPTGARHRRDDGLVLTDYDVCFGCRYCQVACPYGVNYFGWSDASTAGGGFDGETHDARGKRVIGAPPRGVMGKCIYCPGRQDSAHQNSSTECSLACPMGVIHYGDLKDPQSEPNLYLQKRIQESNGRLSTFRLLESLGTRPNVIYIGHQPSARAEPRDGPVRYEDWGFVEERRIVLEGPEPWFKRMIGR
jgi:molybdopterin-containing oxidoreductase family iron-sulfur binding subunit